MMLPSKWERRYAGGRIGRIDRQTGELNWIIGGDFSSRGLLCLNIVFNGDACTG